MLKRRDGLIALEGSGVVNISQVSRNRVLFCCLAVTRRDINSVSAAPFRFGMHSRKFR